MKLHGPIVGLGVILALASQQAWGQDYRTVTWFANHPAQMRGVLRICRDNAGVANRNPNCINADEAQTIVAQRELAVAGDVGSPLSPRYWQTHPTERRQQLWICQSISKQGVTPDATTAQMCAAAKGG